MPCRGGQIGPFQLYDVDSDFGETTNLALSRRQVVQWLTRLATEDLGDGDLPGRNFPLSGRLSEDLPLVPLN